MGIKVSPEQIKKFAPILRIHPSEKYFPMDPLEFIRKSRFRHHRSPLGDEGYNKATGLWDKSDSHNKKYYNIPIEVIDRHGPDDEGRNRRPHDPNRGKKCNMFLQPRGNPTGVRNLNPDRVPIFYYTGSRTEEVHSATGTRVETYRYIQYWRFHGFNDGFMGQNHQGDWEHVTVKVSRGRFAGVWFAAHGKPAFRRRDEMEWKRGRFIVYSAKGSHASYHKEGLFHLRTDQAKNGGPTFELNTADSLKGLNVQPWRHFAGAWGEVGQIKDTTGPLGPWYKRRNH